MSVLLELRGATKKFRNISAIEDIDFVLNRGEVHAIVGENGAGKSTLTKTFAGVYSLTSGEMFFEGRPVSLDSPADGLKLGIAMVYQETNLI
ncbi:ATP-binding cassette domain-containing protein, partial [Rhizobiaceae sp. 2RAB30]